MTRLLAIAWKELLQLRRDRLTFGMMVGIPVMQPTKVRPPELAAELRALDVEVALVVAYGRILPKGLLEAPRRGCVNVHASLLPRWRGAAPIQWAVAEGDAESGVCLMEMDEGLDTGPVFARSATPIGPDETAGELGPRLSAMGADLVRAALPGDSPVQITIELTFTLKK